jgi:hypothetical protein
MSFTPFSAKNAVVRVGAAGASSSSRTTVFTAKSWEFTPSTNPADVTNFEGAGYADWIGTIIEGEYKIDDSDWDATSNPYDSPTNFQPCQIVSISAFIWKTTGPYWDMPNALCLGAPNTARVREAMKISSVSFKTKATFTAPTGSVNTNS